MIFLFSSTNASCVADALGLGRLSDDEPGMDHAHLRKIYRHARGEDGQRVMFQSDPSFQGGWINLDSQRAHGLLSVYLSGDEAENLKQARKNVAANLQAQPWPQILGIDDPLIKCRVKTHGSKWALRFDSAGGGMRGRIPHNEQLPPSPIIDQEDQGLPEIVATRKEDPPVVPAVRNAAVSAGPSPEDVLQEAGFPR